VPRALLLLLLAASGCAVHVPVPKTAAEPAGDPWQAWARVLERRVDESGRIDFAGLAGDRSDLDAAVAAIAAASPRSSPAGFPTKESALAYYINAYNALAMYNVLQSGIPAELGTIKVRFFYRNRLVVGGERISLYALENDVIRPIGDPRIHFALNCMVRACPRLPREAFQADRLDAQLESAAREFFADPRHVGLDEATQTVRFSEILRFYTEDFLAAAPSLIAYANRYRDEKIPETWKVAFIPYDWTLNSR
jgi:hypothetical protein